MSQSKFNLRILLLISLASANALAQKPELVVQTGHAQPVRSVAFSPDGKTLVSGSFDGTLKFWDTESGRLRRTIAAHLGRVNRLVFSVDGAALASESKPGQSNAENFADETVKLWDVRTGKLLLKLELAPFAFSPDGRTFAARDGEAIKLWDTRDVRLLHTLAGHDSTVDALAFSPDGKLLGSGGEGDDRAKLWDVESGNFLFQLQGCAEAHFSPDGTLVADSSGNVCEVETGKLLHGHAGQFVTFSPDGMAVVLRSFHDGGASAGKLPKNSDSLEILHARSGKLIHSFSGFKWNTFHAAYSPEGQSFVIHASGEGGDIGEGLELWDAREWRPLYNRKDYSFCSFSPDGKHLVAARDLGEGEFVLELLETRSGDVRAVLVPEEDGDGQTIGQQRWSNMYIRDVVDGAIFNSDSRVLVAPQGETLRLWDVPSGELRHTFRGSRFHISALAFSPGDKTFVVSRFLPDSDSQRYELWEAHSGTLTRAFTSADTSENDGVWLDPQFIGFTPEGLLVTGDGWLRNAQSGESVSHFGGFIATGARTNAVLTGTHVELRDARSGRVFRRIVAPGARRVALSPDGRLLAVSFGFETLSKGGPMLKIYDATSGRLLRIFTEVDDLVTKIIFSPDSRLLALTFGSGSGGFVTNYVFDARTGRLLTDFFGNEPDNEEADNNRANLLAFSTNSKGVVLQGREDGTVELRDARTGSSMKTLTGVVPYAHSAAFSSDGRILATGDGDTAVRFWSIETGELLATALSLPTGDWLTLTPDGLFDGSPGAWSEILWRFSEDTFNVAPAELFFNEFYYPGLLAEVFAGGRPRASQNIADKDRRQPRVQIEMADERAAAAGAVAARTISLRLKVAEAPPDETRARGSGAQDVRLFRNGSLVKIWHGDVLQGQSSVTLEATVPVVAGNNKFTAYSFNKDNVKSNDATLTIRGADILKRDGTLYIIAVGVNEYADSSYNLNYAVPDAQEFSKELQRQQQSLKNYANIEVILLLNREATKENVLSALKRLAKSDDVASSADAPEVLKRIKPIQPEDAVLIYFAGHGTAEKDRFYLIPHDLGFTGQEKQLSAKAKLRVMLEHSISDIELNNVLEGIDAGKLLMVIDACNSGQALEAEEKRRGPMNSKGLAQLAYEKGMYILTASQSYQAALEVSELGHGLLTYALVGEGLRQAKAEKNEKNEIVERRWLNYAVERVPLMQLEKMKRRDMEIQRRRAGARAKLVFVPGDNPEIDPAKRGVQRPRVFYRRELESQPWVIAKAEIAPVRR